MTIKELLAPRYKVLADYPFSPFQIKQIVEGRDTQGMEQWPHLFQPLFWYQHREKVDLPEYVRIREWVWKVDEWGNGVLDLLPYAESDNERPWPKGYEPLSIKWYFCKKESTPATEEEYRQFCSTLTEAPARL